MVKGNRRKRSVHNDYWLRDKLEDWLLYNNNVTEALDVTIKFKNLFVNRTRSQVFRLESIKLHQESSNHARAKCA